jgi:hypothetical protein
MLLPRRRVPVKSPTGACSFSITAACDFSVSCTCFKKTVPASVSTTPLLEFFLQKLDMLAHGWLGKMKSL